MRGVAARRVDPMIQGAVQTKQLERLWEQLAKDGNRPDPNVPVAAETLKPVWQTPLPTLCFVPTEVQVAEVRSQWCCFIWSC